MFVIRRAAPGVPYSAFVRLLASDVVLSGTKPIAVIGLGNPLRVDEGVGVAVVQRLRCRAAAPQVELLDLGTSGMALLHALAGREKAVIVDCAFLGEAPGTIRRFRPEEARSLKGSDGLSIHDSDALRIIELSRSLGECPPEVVLFGIQPADIGYGPELSPALAARLDEYAAAVAAELAPPAP